MTIDEAIKILDAIPTKGDEVDAMEMAIEALEEAKPSGFYQCFHCGAKAVSWDSDFDFSDMGYDGEGIVNCCHCNNCGAEIEYRVRLDEEETPDEKET